jgi:pyruvate-formate lyase-activating enzyme
VLVPLQQLAVGALAKLGERERLGFLQPPNYPLQTVTLKKLLNLYLARYHYARGHTKLRSYPVRLTIETTNACNLRCPHCFTGAGQVGRQKSVMSTEFFKNVLDELGPYLFFAEMHNWGEPLLNKNIYDMFALAKQRGVSTLISSNFSIPFSREQAETLVESGLVRLGVSLDGARQETYERYRVKGKFDRVMENIALVNEAKAKLRSSTPQMIWEFHVFDWNKDDIPLAQAMAAERNMPFAASKGYVIGDDWDPEENYPYSPEPYEAGVAPERCDYLWFQAVINNDAGASPCCGTFFKEHDFGSLDGSFKSVWNNESYQQARRLFSKRDESGKSLICYECPRALIWNDFQQHRAAGHSVSSFAPAFRSNDGWNYFWNQRPQQASVPSDAIELTPVGRGER